MIHVTLIIIRYIFINLKSVNSRVYVKKMQTRLWANLSKILALSLVEEGVWVIIDIVNFIDSLNM